jgi:caspase domain-containing protein
MTHGILVWVAVLLGLVSTGLGKTMRQEKAHGQPMSAPSWSGDSIHLDTDRLALVIGNSNYLDADSPLPQMTRDAEGLTNALRKSGFLVQSLTMRRDAT